MSESEQQWDDSPLLSERGATTISNTVVSSIAGRAAQEVEGVHMGGGASRTASGVLGSITGSESQTRGVSVEVGSTETAIDLKMGIDYGRNILQTVEEVRRRITDRVQAMTGLRITELNATITDITFPEKEERRRLGSGSRTRELGSADETGTASDTRTMPSEPPPGASEETTQVESRSPTNTESTSEPVPEEEDRPPEGDETAELRPGDTGTEEQLTSEASETPEESDTSAETETPEEPETRAEAETSEETEAEARRRRRAEERARRRRRTEDS
jgi:uncharacterized alkaline shock family protein YloU